MCKDEFPERPDISLQLYQHGGPWRESGVIYTEDWNAYALGYLEALEGLIKRVKDQGFLADTFGYPIFFLFTHYLEIRMKEIILHGRDLIDEPPDFLRGHKLNDLWNECKRIFKIIEKWDDYSQLGEDTRQNYQTIDHFINEIAIDNSAQSFRYPVDRNGNPLLSDPRIKSLNVHNLAIVAEWVSFHLEGFSTGIDEYRKQKNEIAAEYYQEGFE